MSAQNKPVRGQGRDDSTCGTGGGIAEPWSKHFANVLQDALVPLLWEDRDDPSSDTSDLKAERSQRRQVNLIPIKDRESAINQVEEIVAKVIRDLADRPDLLAQFLKGYTQAVDLLFIENSGE